MKKKLSLVIPNEKIYVPQAVDFLKRAMEVAGVGSDVILDIVDAARELLFNAVNHAYPPQISGNIDIDLQFLPNGIELSVHDMGLPFDYRSHMASQKEGGLKRTQRYVDRLSFANLGKKGKSFTIFKIHPLEISKIDLRPYSDLEDESPASLKPASIQIRDFEPGDEEAVSRLIYSNYTYSYYKSLFYYPKKIRELNESGKIASVVAETKEGDIIGHFALVRVPDSNIAEIGVAVVHPDYKGKGVMNSMLSRIIIRAKETGLAAIFGEALMLHTYSQKANLRHGFGESALLLGLVPNSVLLTDPNTVRTQKRAAVLVAYKILDTAKSRSIFMPQIYAKTVEQIYINCGLEATKKEKKERPDQNIMSISLSPYTQSGTLVIDTADKDFAHQIKYNLHRLYRKHVDMIYADINMMRCSNIDRVIEVLKGEGFVFAGVLFYRRGEDDYLRLQMPNSDYIDMGEQAVCHSGFCLDLLSLITKELDASGFFENPVGKF